MTPPVPTTTVPAPDRATPPAAAGGTGAEAHEERLTIDELADRTGVSVRTIRFYRDEGLLHPPVRRGRQALYDRDHVDRLRAVAVLRERGLALDAIKRLLAEAAAEQTVWADLLDTGDALRSSWVDDRPARLGRDEVLAELGLATAPDDEVRAALERLERSGIVVATGDGCSPTFDVPSPAALRLIGRLGRGGVRADVLQEAGRLISRHLDALADDLVTLLDDRLDAAGAGHDDDLPAVLDRLKPAALNAVLLVFSGQLDRAAARRAGQPSPTTNAR